MDTALARKWIEELRSNTYEQGNGQLRDKNNRYCCLGVLCDMYVKKDKGEWKEASDKFFYSREDQASAYSLTKYLMDDTYMPTGDEAILSEMNDDGCTFVEIADYLERKYIKGEEVNHREYIQNARERICAATQRFDNSSKENT